MSRLTLRVLRRTCIILRVNIDDDLGRIAPELETTATRPAPRRRVDLASLWSSWTPGAGLPALLLCLISLADSAWVSTTVFDRLPHVEDDVAFLFQARTIASGHLLASPPSLPVFFQIPFVIIRDGHWFGKYPPGYPMVLAIGVLFGHPWLLNPVVGAIDVGLVFIAGRRFFDEDTGLLAAALLVASPFFLLQSGSFMSHTVTLFWSMTFLLLFEATRRTRSIWRGALAGFAIGMLFISRPLTAVGIGIPFVVWVLIDVARDWRRLREYVPIAAVFVLFALSMLEYNRVTTGNAFRFAYELWWPYDKIGFGPNVGRGGHTLADGLQIVHYNVNQLGHYLFGWPGRLSLVPMFVGVVLAICGLIWRGGNRLYRSRSALPTQGALGPQLVPEVWDLLLAGMVVSLIGVHIAYWTPGLMYGPRYYFEAIGAMVLLSSRGILGVARLLSIPLRRAGPRLPSPKLWTSGLLIVVVAGLTLWNFMNFAPTRFQEFTDWYNINADGLREVHDAGVHHAVVFVREAQWTDYAPFFSQDTPALNGDIVYAIDQGNANRQLMEEYPGRAYYLYAGGKLTRLTGP
jgi:4-amino-4-deoxy-L-arabinose transferase-like glycosyltransferase